KETAEGTLEGIISGRAIYDGRIDPAAAAALLRGAPS
ncbi:MAG: 1-(5-phosphoribosyl)-5-((5-phosphoribosylamino)methylideneamino)imidazole-4-carboxamide isomerase, partial [Proteobacteria bacterium]|nr:1-(5-phosphoribosyl)-5-((5-phosphoribosylamino)methylideneamino)imidazole-4-carboxamide isomerase [Pseudomonadota bacterium]